MRLGTFLHVIIWPSLVIVGGLLLLTPRDLLRQPIIQQTGSARVVAAADAGDIMPATLTVRATALPPASTAPRLDFVATEPAVSSLPSVAPVPSVDRRFITAGALNLRNGPSVNAGLIASLPLGTPVEVIETSGNWAHVAAGDAEGWLSTRFLSADAPD